MINSHFNYVSSVCVAHHKVRNLLGFACLCKFESRSKAALRVDQLNGFRMNNARWRKIAMTIERQIGRGRCEDA